MKIRSAQHNKVSFSSLKLPDYSAFMFRFLEFKVLPLAQAQVGPDREGSCSSASGLVTELGLIAADSLDSQDSIRAASMSSALENCPRQDLADKLLQECRP